MTKVCVTGASGYIALHLIEQLLAAGHQVNGTVRDKDNAAKTEAIRSLSGADERLTLFSADLVGPPDSFDEAVAGCEVIFHVASPYITKVDDPEKELIRPAVDGVKKVLESSVKSAKSVKRFILTSSIAAITDEAVDGYTFTEKDFNTKSSLTRNPYYHSKYLSEKFAHDFMESDKPDFDLVVVNPFIVIGPSMTKTVGESAEKVLLAAFKGEFQMQLPILLGIVDVRDVAKAHILAMTKGKPGNRYLCAGDNVPQGEIMNYLIELGYSKDTGYKIPTSVAGSIAVALMKMASYIPGVIPADMVWFMRLQLGKNLNYDNSKIKEELGMQFRPWKETVADTLTSLHEWGHIKDPPKTQTAE